MIAELNEPTPIGVFAFLSLFAANIACFIRSKKSKKSKNKKYLRGSQIIRDSKLGEKVVDEDELSLSMKKNK